MSGFNLQLLISVAWVNTADTVASTNPIFCMCWQPYTVYARDIVCWLEEEEGSASTTRTVKQKLLVHVETTPI